MSDSRDLVITMLADSEAELRARVVDLEADNRILRELLSVTLEQLHLAVSRIHYQRLLRQLDADRAQLIHEQRRVAA